MTQHKVISEDSLSAMDEISKVLGKEAVILSTKKINGKIEIIGSNDIKDVLKSKKTNKTIKKINFQDLFSKHPIKKNEDQPVDNSKKNDQEKLLISENKINDHNYKVEFEDFKNELHNLFKNMVITDINSVSNNYDKSCFMKLMRQGFTKNIINSIFLKLDNLDFPKTEINFYKQLSKKLIFPFKENVKSSNLIFVTGFTGVGKTTLSSKIASYLLDNNTVMKEMKNISLINLSVKSSNNVSDLINFGRLINVNVHSLSNIDDLKKFVNANPSRKLIIDVSRDFLIKDDFNSYLEELSKMTQTSILLAIQSGINKNSLKKQISFFKNVKPIIALTKLDETPIGAEEFSILAEINSKIGLLSASKNIIDAIAFTKDEILAQYMKEM